MNRQILVSTNCQAEGIAEALSVMLPDDSVNFSNILDKRNSTEYLNGEIFEKLSVLITSDELCKTEEFARQSSNLRIIFIPRIVFSAFHPDIVYVKNSKGLNLRCLDSDYHSAICFWAWKNNLDAEQTIKLFCESTFRKLGYMDNWSESLSELKDRFKGTDTDFGRFWSKIKRNIPFMYSFNHPNIIVLSELAKQVAIKLGADESLYDQPIHHLLTEKLDAIRWPIYPPLATLYGVEGMYRWKIRGAKYNSLFEYITESLKCYDNMSIPSDELSFNASGYELFDKKMRSIVWEDA